MTDYYNVSQALDILERTGQYFNFSHKSLKLKQFEAV